MPGPDLSAGYRTSQKVLHWLTVLAVAAQFAVGYNLDLDDRCDPAGGGPRRRRHQ